MAVIAINDLRPTGAELFLDAESFMADLNDSELGDINGGITPSWYFAAVGVSALVGYLANK
jgi:hypothetical protein